MFDRLIETDPTKAEFKGRKAYFMVSSVVMGIIFVSAVVISIFAADLNLGNRDFDLVVLVAPPTQAAMEPEPPKPQPLRTKSTNTDQVKTVLPTRKAVVARLDEQPKDVPTAISTVKNIEKERPYDRFIVGGVDRDPPVGTGTSGRDTNNVGTVGGTGLSEVPATVKAPEREPEPPTPPVVKKPEPPAKKSIVSGGVVNGKATSLPKPTYSAAAIAVKAQGKVQVQVLIDESGQVISATAISGHPLLQQSAVTAAKNARFSPTFLSGVAVKVKGVIVYNFTK